ncbi:hypothetical protein ACFLXW_00440 [Candidatus Dependentiae bacterium]
MGIAKLLFVGILILNSFNCQAMEYESNQSEGNQVEHLQDFSIRKLIMPLIVALLALSGKATEAANITNPTCPALDMVPTRHATPLRMATVYFDGANCAPRCIAQADWLGPLQAFCADSVGCEDMFLSGAEACDVDPVYVAEYNCSITHTPRIFTLPKPQRSKRARHKRKRRG